MANKQLVTLITGADKGIGFATAEALGKIGQHVIIGSRDNQRGKDAEAKLRTEGIDATVIVLDATSQQQINDAVTFIQQKFGYLSILINNAGIALDQHRAASTIDIADIRRDFDVNFFGAIAVTQAMIPLLKQDRPAKIINVSSDMGSLTYATDPSARLYHVSAVGYQSSKASLNFFTINLSKELADEQITVNAVNPGQTATEFGGRPKGMPKLPGMNDVATGAAQIIKMASLARDDGTTGTFTDNNGALPW